MRNRNQVVRRVVTMLRVMRTHRPTLRDLADEMGCSERTARRYVESLEQASVPVHRHGPRYRIEERA